MTILTRGTRKGANFFLLQWSRSYKREPSISINQDHNRWNFSSTKTLLEMTHLFQSSRPYKKSLSFFIIKELSINQDHNRWNSTSSIIKALVEMNLLLQSSRNNPLQDFSHHKIIWNPTSSRHYWKRPSSFNHQDQKNHVPSSLFNIQFLLQSSNNTRSN